MVKICFAQQLATIYYPEKNTRRINDNNDNPPSLSSKNLTLPPD